MCVLLGVARGDGAVQAGRLAGKIAQLRIFEDEQGRFAHSLLD
ncbi:MAG: D-Tyr-tRNA(Tyr) deacylase, partial [Gaiellaceae bacterium]|nr:D-Tyr-tRNA(Tyr) deacylase [Gaiellaceae bacterium]